MSRYRTIKPDFWSSEQIIECSPNARLMFIGLWNFCDDAGRHLFSPKQIKAEIFPGDNLSSDIILGMLNELSSNGLIVVYESDNKHILQVTGWHHQKIDKPQKPKFPGPSVDSSANARRRGDESSCLINDDGSPNYRRTSNEHSTSEQKKERKYQRKKEKNIGEGSRMEGKGENIAFSSKKLSPISLDRALSGKNLEFEEELFWQFWYAYGHRQQRKRAEQAFTKAIAKTDLETILAGVKRYRETRPAWQQIALASAWLDGERWTDETATEAKPNGPGVLEPRSRAPPCVLPPEVQLTDAERQERAATLRTVSAEIRETAKASGEPFKQRRGKRNIPPAASGKDG